MAIQFDLPAEVLADMLREDRLDAFAHRLRRSTRKRIPIQDVWQAFGEIWPRYPQGAQGRRWLRAVLESLADQGVLRLPAIRGKSWDRTSSVPLPLAIDLITTKSTGERAWREFAWHPALQWVLDLSQLTARQEQFLYRVQRGLTKGWFHSIAPLKYRSLQLTGDEKAMGRFVGTSLFGPGRLTLTMIGCQADTTPIAWERVGDAPHMVMFENAGSFLVALTLLKQMADPPYGMAAYGGGEHVLKGIDYLQWIDHPLKAIHYVGDLDRKGITIAKRLKERAMQQKLPVMAESRLHAEMIRSAAELNAPSGWPAKSKPHPVSDDDLSFLHANHRSLIRNMLAKNFRIPEEVLNEDALKRAWYPRSDERRSPRPQHSGPD